MKISLDRDGGWWGEGRGMSMTLLGGGELEKRGSDPRISFLPGQENLSFVLITLFHRKKNPSNFLCCDISPVAIGFKRRSGGRKNSSSYCTGCLIFTPGKGCFDRMVSKPWVWQTTKKPPKNMKCCPKTTLNFGVITACPKQANFQRKTELNSKTALQ